MKTWFALKKIEDAIRVDLYDEIGGWGIRAIDFKQALDEAGPGDLSIHINSPGGSITEGTAMYNILKGREGKKTVHIDGIAASMASVVAMAGDEIVMPENAFMMIHNPWTVAIGDAEELRKNADLLDKMKVSIISAYRRSGKKDEEIAALMDAETWMDGKEAVAMGFANRTTEALKMAAAVDVSKLTTGDRVSVQLAKWEAYAEGYAAALGQRSDTSAQLDGLQAKIIEAAGVIAGLQANLKTAGDQNAKLTTELTSAKSATADAEKRLVEEQAKRAALLTGALFQPELGWSEALTKCNNDYEKARKEYPQAYASYMEAKAPNTRRK
jgi:ATP-dependent protease ClpP protease subunit